MEFFVLIWFKYQANYNVEALFLIPNCFAVFLSSGCLYFFFCFNALLSRRSEPILFLEDHDRLCLT